MNQLMRVSDTLVIWAVARAMRFEEYEAIMHRWRDTVGDDIRLAVFPETTIVDRGESGLLFEFTGDVTPTFAAEFRRWWEGATA